MSDLLTVKSFKGRELPIQKRDLKRKLASVDNALMCAVSRAWEAGLMLRELKYHCKHGDWENLLIEVNLKPRTAQRYMRLYNGYESPDLALEQGTMTKALEKLGKEDNSPEGEQSDMFDKSISKCNDQGEVEKKGKTSSVTGKDIYIGIKLSEKDLKRVSELRKKVDKTTKGLNIDVEEIYFLRRMLGEIDSNK